MDASRARLILVSAIWVVFFVFGLQLAGIGPLISTFAERANVSIETVGILFTVQSFASLISAAAIGQVLDRYSLRPVILFGLICVGVGTLGLMLSHAFVLMLASIAIVGFGVGFMDTGGQLLVVALFREKSARPLNSLHFLFSVGAVIGPILAVQFGIAMLVVAVIMLAAILPVLLKTLPHGLRAGGPTTGEKSPSLYRSPVLWLFALIILLYVGLEIGVGGWTTEYLSRSTPLDKNGAGLVTSLYWLSFMLSRLVVTAVGNRLTFERQMIFSVVLAMIASVIYVLSVGSTAGSIVATLMIGFSFGPVYPAVFAIVTREFSSSSGRAAGVIGAMGSIGLMVIVPVQGVLLERGGPTAMAVYVAVVVGAMLIAYLLASRGAKARFSAP